MNPVAHDHLLAAISVWQRTVRALEGLPQKADVAVLMPDSEKSGYTKAMKVPRGVVD